MCFFTVLQVGQWIHVREVPSQRGVNQFPSRCFPSSVHRASLGKNDRRMLLHSSSQVWCLYGPSRLNHCKLESYTQKRPSIQCSGVSRMRSGFPSDLFPWLTNGHLLLGLLHCREMWAGELVGDGWMGRSSQPMSLRQGENAATPPVVAGFRWKFKLSSHQKEFIYSNKLGYVFPYLFNVEH